MTAMHAYYSGSPTVLFEEPRLPKRLTANPDAEFDRPDWRWRTAEYLRKEYANGIALVDMDTWRPHRRMDPLVAGRLLPFLSQYNDGNISSAAKDHLTSQYPGMYWAVKVFECDIVTRYYLEAMFLGGAEPYQIAAEIHTDENYVWHYEKMFFDIRQHLNNQVWIESKVGMPAVLTCPSEYYRQGIMWKAIATIGGWEIFARNSSMWNPADARIMNRIRDLIHDKNVENALIVEVVRRINRYSEGQIKEENLRQRELDLKQRQIDEAEGKSSNPLEEIAAMILDHMGRSIEKPPATELELEAVQNDPDQLDFKQRDHEIIERAREENRAPRSEELTDG